MAELTASLSKATVYLRLGRVSNLPTVWTNAVAAVVLSGRALELPTLIGLFFAISCFYVGGMFLNDAFDREIDAIRRPERPIPAGLIGIREVFAGGFLLLFVGWGTITMLAGADHPQAPHAALALGLAVVLYDASHRHALAPFIMGACRGLVYLTVALTVSDVVTVATGVGAAVLTVYVTGLSLASKWYPGSHRLVAILIAGIAVLDALLILSMGHLAVAVLTLLGFPLTLLFQRWVRGT